LFEAADVRFEDEFDEVFADALGLPFATVCLPVRFRQVAFRTACLDQK
jgi:hypothetical protein